MTALIIKEKKIEYEKNNENAKTRGVKNENKKIFNNQSINEKRKSKLCNNCKNLFHTEKQYYYLHFKLKKED